MWRFLPVCIPYTKFKQNTYSSATTPTQQAPSPTLNSLIQDYKLCACWELSRRRRSSWRIQLLRGSHLWCLHNLSLFNWCQESCINRASFKMRVAYLLAPHGLSLTFDFPCVRFGDPFGQNKTLQEVPTPTPWASWKFYHWTPSAASFRRQGTRLSWAWKKIWCVYFFSPLIQTRLIRNIGGIVHLKCFGKHLILLNDLQMAVDLLEKRGSNYSGRPLFPIHERYG